jgi:hypothetical protein
MVETLKQLRSKQKTYHKREKKNSMGLLDVRVHGLVFTAISDFCLKLGCNDLKS